jgi:hypothetical protein
LLRCIAPVFNIVKSLLLSHVCSVRKYYIFGKTYLKILMDVHVFSSPGYEKILGKPVGMCTMLALAW